MNLKQLINELQEIHEEHGNLEVEHASTGEIRGTDYQMYPNGSETLWLY